MTLAPHRPLGLRLAAVAAAVVLCLLLGVMTVLSAGVGPALFLFALAAVGLVDMVLTLRRGSGSSRSERGPE